MERAEITADFVARLVGGQFPALAGLPVTPVPLNGWDNTTFRLGDELTVRLPSGPSYSLQVEKEHRLLPLLAPRLPLPIPVPVSRGEPALGFPWPWSIYRFIEGEPAEAGLVSDLCQFACSLADFLAALERVEPELGPPPGEHSLLRGAHVSVYDDETRAALEKLAGEIDVAAAEEVWEAALATSWRRPPVFCHGDVSFSNLLVREGTLAAVIDFGMCAVGDPACDTVISWTLFDERSRELFRDRRGLDADTVARGRGWALWKALVTLVAMLEIDPGDTLECRRVIAEIISDYRNERSADATAPPARA